MKRRARVLLTAALAFVITLILGGAAGAEDHGGVADSGVCGDSLTWTLYEDGLLEISGEGKMDDYSQTFEDRPPWYSYRSSCTKLKLSPGVTAIGSYAFMSCSQFQGELIIPDGVVSIGDTAFWGCRGFTGALVLPDSVATIADSAFAACSGLTSLVIPHGVMAIGDSAFSNCSGLKQVKISEGVETIGSGAFFGCSSITSLSLPSSLTVIESSAFSACRSLTRLIIPNSVCSIGDSAFSSCSKLERAVFKGNAPSMGSNVFYNCADAFAVYCYEDFADSFTASPGYKASSGTWYGCRLKILPVPIPGDIDGDGKPATPKDAMVLARYIAGWDGYEDMIVLEAADLDGDGKPATPKDAMILARHIAGWDGYETLPLK